MKWLIASDLHGSALYTEKLMEAFAAEKAERLLLLGDLLFTGPHVALPDGQEARRVIDLLNEKKDRIFCVRGNCDAEADAAALRFHILSDHLFLHDGALPLFATHGHLYTALSYPPLEPGTVILQGHTHIPLLEKGAHPRLNPGSVSLPRGGSRHGYMTLENGLFLWKTLDGTPYMEFLP